MKAAAEPAAIGAPPWLEVITGRTPVLLIAPHGGRAASAAPKRANPRINDLHTADLARELAHRLDAGALINQRMDRNQLDCNRIGQLVAGAPEFLMLLAEQIESIVSRHGHVCILVIHGWNVIEARIDFGIGATMVGDELRTPGAAVVTASPQFIDESLSGLCRQLAAAGIVPTIGFRYPAGGRHNLLQAFTVRKLEASHDALTRISALAARGAIDAVQIELSVAVRWPGPLRDATLALIAGAFAPRPQKPAPPAPAHRSRPGALLPQTPPSKVRSPHRFSLEFYDPENGIGVIASADLSGGGGSRVAILAGNRLAICTADGIAQTDGDARLRLGPLSFSAGRDGFEIEFRGPMLIVPDATAYTRLERAFSSAQLDPAASLRCRFTTQTATGPLSFRGVLEQQPLTHAAFGSLEGELTLAGVTRGLRAIGRAGAPYLNPIDFAITSRCWLWACVSGHPKWTALEAGLIHRSEGAPTQRARAVMGGTFIDGAIGSLLAQPRSLGTPPPAIQVQLALANGELLTAIARPRSFMALARPGLEATRIYTSVGFASFDLDGFSGIGMFECSDAADAVSGRPLRDHSEG